MILTTTFEVPGKDYEIIALVNGNTVQSKNAFKDIKDGALLAHIRRELYKELYESLIEYKPYVKAENLSF